MICMRKVTGICVDTAFDSYALPGEELSGDEGDSAIPLKQQNLGPANEFIM